MNTTLPTSWTKIPYQAGERAAATAYAQGWGFAQKAAHQQPCPYAEGTTEHEAWQNGFEDALEDDGKLD